MYFISCYFSIKMTYYLLSSLSYRPVILATFALLSLPDTTCSSLPRCPLTADPRANTHSAISAMYALLAREHNRIAGQLSETNPHWGDERAYQETRRLITAQLQHITFKEFVPAVLGQVRLVG